VLGRPTDKWWDDPTDDIVDCRLSIVD